jgi:hypothetical protein
LGQWWLEPRSSSTDPSSVSASRSIATQGHRVRACLARGGELAGYGPQPLPDPQLAPNEGPNIFLPLIPLVTELLNGANMQWRRNWLRERCVGIWN